MKKKRPNTPYLDIAKIVLNQNTEDYIYQNLVNHIESAISGSGSSNIFKIKNTSYAIALDKTSWAPALNTARVFYENKADFETCAKIRDLLSYIDK